MSFIKTPEEIAMAHRETGEFYDAEMLTVVWETKPEIVERLLPPHLKPAEHPLAVAFVAHYPKTNFGVTYRESALFLRTRFNGETGAYCLSMSVTDDMALVAGREIYGYPKKLATIELTHAGDYAQGWARRRGIQFFEVRANLSGKFNEEEAKRIFSNVLGDGTSVVIAYNYKHFPSPDGEGFDYNPRLIREEVELHPSMVQAGEAEVVLKPSDYDPWSEVEVVKVLGAIYSRGNNKMRRGKVIAEADPSEFAPHAFLKWDKRIP
jgi:acetoacetate decarboxylase